MEIAFTSRNSGGSVYSKSHFFTHFYLNCINRQFIQLLSFLFFSYKYKSRYQMDPNNRIRKAPPIPKFKDTGKSDPNAVQAKVTDFLNQIEKQSTIKPKQQESIQKTAKISAASKATQMLNSKKLNLASLNSKLNSILITKNINLNKLSKDIQSTPKSEPTEQSAAIPPIQQQYDPQYPNSFENVKSTNTEIVQKIKKISEQGSYKDQQALLNDKISEWIKQHEMTDENQEFEMEIQNQEDEVLQEKEEVALRIMQRYGFKLGEGLGKNNQGIQAPLIAKKVTDSSCKIEQSAISLARFIKPQKSAENALKAFKIQKTRVIVLVIPDLKIENLTDETEQQIKEQCSKGSIVQQWILFSLNDAMRIFAKFSSTQQAFKAFMRINGRFYDQKRIMVYFYNEQSFQSRHLAIPLHTAIEI